MNAPVKATAMHAMTTKLLRPDAKTPLEKRCKG